MRGMTIKRSYKLQNRFKIFSGDRYIPTGDNAVFDIISGNLLIRSKQMDRRILELVRLITFQCTYHSYFCHDTARVDSQSGDGTAHFVVVGKSRTEEQIGKESVELLLLLVGEPERMDSMCFHQVELLFPFQAYVCEDSFQIGFTTFKLIDPCPYTMHVIKQLAREQTVLCRGNKWFHLCGRTGKQDGQIAFLYFPVFLVGTPVVRQTVMVERFAERVAPVSVFRADGSRNSICFRFADKSRAVGIHDILQNTCSGVIARDEKHSVFGHLGSFHFATLFSHDVVGGFLFFVSLDLCRYLLADLVMDRFDEQTDKRKNSLTRGRRSHDKTLQARRLEFAGVWTSHISFHAGTYGSQCSEQHDVTLGRAGGIAHDEQEDFRPVRFGESGQWLVRVTTVQQLFGFVRFVILHLIIYVCVCENFGWCIFRIFCISTVVHNFRITEFHIGHLGKMESRTQVHFPMSGSESIGEYPFGMFTLVLGGRPAQTVEKLASRFSAIRCDGKRQLYIFSIGRSNIRSCSFNRFSEAV